MNIKDHIENSLIFIQIPAYRDSQLVATIDSLISEACNAARLRIAICWQHGLNEKLPKRITTNTNIQIIDIDYKASKGANWARSVVQKKWNNEPYTMLIDSHIRFTKKWDSQLIKMMLQLQRNNFSKPLITGYPPPFDPVFFPKKRLNYPLKMYVEGYYYGLLMKFNGMPIPHFKWLKSPVEAHFIALGFLFTVGSFNKEIPFDPHIYFYGDEITTGLRAYCHGYHFFHPHRVIAWHLYERKTRIPHWDNHKNWSSLDDQSCSRTKAIFKGTVFKKFPLGTIKTILDYEKFIGFKLIANEQY